MALLILFGMAGIFALGVIVYALLDEKKNHFTPKQRADFENGISIQDYAREKGIKI